MPESLSNDLDQTPPLAQRLDAVRAGVSAAAVAAGRSVDEITTIVVTKFHPVELVGELLDLGVRDFGENRHQDARGKAEALATRHDGAAGAAHPSFRWHFVGQLQSKKARQVRAYADVLQSIDRSSLVDALASEEPADARDVFVQINLTDDPGRGGVGEAELEGLAEHVLAAPGLRLLGVMAVAPLGEEPRAAFARLRALSERVVAIEPSATSISAGMSHDYAEAIAEGATHLRIGTAITGNRPNPG